MNTFNEATKTSIRIPSERPGQPQVQSAKAETGAFSSLSKLMRVLGAVALVASGVAFLFEGWHNLTNLGKFGAFSAFLLSLGAAGAFCSRVLNEQKGARSFLGLAAAGVTVQAAQIGAVSYAMVHPSASDLSSFMLYAAAGTTTLAVMVAVFLLLLVPVAGLGFAVLARPQARLAAGLFLCLNALLLVPTRVDLHALLLGALGVLALALAERRVFRHDPAMATTEGWVLRAILAGPVATMFGREIFYPVGELAAGLACLGAGVGFFLLARHSGVRRALALPAQALSFGFVAFGWLLLAKVAHLSPMLFWLPLSWSAIGLSFASAGDGRNYRSLGAVGTLVGCVAGLHGEGAWLVSANFAVNGLVLVVLAFTVKELSLLRAGLVSFAAGLAFALWTAAGAVEWNSWVALAATGAAAILGSSYVERNRERLVGAYGSFRESTKYWA